jgi:hypothetical protein
MAFHLRAERPEVSLEELQEELQELLLAQQLELQSAQLSKALQVELLES